jgi:hypothetical protein
VATPAPAPRVTITSSNLVLSKGRVAIGIACMTKACSGALDLVETLSVRVTKGKKIVIETETVVLGSATYKLAARKAESIAVSLNHAGTAALGDALRHPAKESVTTTPKGGSAVKKPVIVS